MGGIIDAIIQSMNNARDSGVGQRLGQHVDAANASMQYAHNNPSLGSIGGAFKDTVLGTLLGLPLQALGTAGEGLAGEAAVIGAANQLAHTRNPDGSYPDTTANQAAQQLTADPQALLHPLRAYELATHSPDQGTSLLTGALGLAANPANYAGSIGEFGRGLEAGAPLAGRTIAGLGQALSGLNEVSGAPIGMLTRGGRARLAGILDQLAAPGQQAAPALTQELPRLAQQYAGVGDRLAEAAARDNAIAQTGLDPSTAFGSRALPNGYKNPAAPALPDAPTPLDLPSIIAGRADYNQAAKASGLPALRYLKPEPSALTVPQDFSIVAAARDLAAQRAEAEAQQAATASAAARRTGAETLNATVPDLGNWVARATDNTLRDMPLGTGPAQRPGTPGLQEALAQHLLGYLPPAPTTLPKPIQPLTDLLGAAQRTAQPTPLEALRQGAQNVAARDVPRRAARPALPTTAETGGTPTRLLPPEAVTAAEEAAAVRFDYPADTPLAQTAAPDFPALAGDRASILRGLDAPELDTLLNVAYGHEDAIANAMNKYHDPAALADAALARITSSSAKAGLLTQAAPDLAQKLAYLPEAVPAVDSAIADVAQSQIVPLSDNSAGALSAIDNSTPPLTGTVDDLRKLILGERDRVGTVYPPNDPQFYQSRANIDPAQLPGMLDQLVQEGTLGRDPVQGLMVRPGGPATDLGARLGQPWSSPADTLSGAQDAPQAVPDVVARGKQAISDLFDEAPASTGNTPSALDQITSSIKNPGLLGFPGGLPSPAVTRALIGGGIGGLGGGATGLAGGLLAGDNPDQLKQETATAALAGVGVGAATGAGLPQLQPATQAALTAIATHAPALLDDTIASPEIQRIAIARGLANQAAAKGVKGAKLADLLPALDNLWRGQTTQTAKNLTQDAGTIRLLVSQFGDEFGTDQAAVRSTLGELARNLDNPDPVAQAGGLGQTLAAIGQQKLLIPTSATDTTRGLHNLLGVDMVSNTTNKGTQLNAPQRVAAGMGIGLANAVTRISPLSLVAGGARAYVAPFADRYFGTLNGLQHDAPRVAFLQGALDRDLPQLAQDFLGDLAAQGVGVKPLEALGGKFDSATLAAEIKRAGGGSQLAAQAAAEWDTLTETLVRGRADRIAHLFGDFRDSANGTAVKGVGRIFPFATWAIKYAPVLAEMMAKHPRVSAGIVGALVADAAQAKQDGRPAYQVGTIPISTETPLIGPLVRARLGGESGTLHLNPLSQLTPYGGQTVSSLGDTPLDSYQTPYQHIMNYANMVGMSPHPLIQAAAYVTGQDFKGPNSLSRTAGLEQLPQALPALLGHNALTDTLATTMPSAQNTLDAARSLISGQSSTAVDPVARRYGELVLAKTGQPLVSAANRAYLDPTNPATQALRDQATREAVLSGAASNAYSLTSPVAASAQSTEAEQAARVRGAVTQLQNTARLQPPLEAAATQEAIRRYQDQHPGALVYDGATKAGLAQLRLADWERQNVWMQAAPPLYNQQKAIVMEQLGLVPAGTYARQVAASLAPQVAGQGQVYLPGGVPFNGYGGAAEAVRALHSTPTSR